MLERLTLNDFEKLLGSEHVLMLEGGRTVPIVLSEARALAESPLGEATRAPFSLVFEAREEGRIEQRTYAVTFSDGATMEIFLVPIGATRDGSLRLQAIFT